MKGTKLCFNCFSCSTAVSRWERDVLWSRLNVSFTFSDSDFTILEVVGQGNRLVKHWNFKGTHTGNFFGIPASGNKLNLSGTTMVTMKDGKIAKEQDFFDMMSMVNQLTTGDVNADETKAGVN